MNAYPQRVYLITFCLIKNGRVIDFTSRKEVLYIVYKALTGLVLGPLGTITVHDNASQFDLRVFLLLLFRCFFFTRLIFQFHQTRPPNLLLIQSEAFVVVFGPQCASPGSTVWKNN